MVILDQLIKNIAGLAERWVAACCAAKDVPLNSPTAIEEWVSGPYLILQYLRLLRQSLSDIAATGSPRIPGPVTVRPNGQVAAQVFPQTIYDRLFYRGVTAEVWMEPDVTLANLPNTQAVAYRRPTGPGQVTLVLGAGNISCLGPADFLYKLFVENRVVIYKSNPVNAYLDPLIAEGFAPLIEAGFLRPVHGGAAEGAYLAQHPGIDEIHLTGSDKTAYVIAYILESHFEK